MLSINSKTDEQKKTENILLNSHPKKSSDKNISLLREQSGIALRKEKLRFIHKLYRFMRMNYRNSKIIDCSVFEQLKTSMCSIIEHP